MIRRLFGLLAIAWVIGFVWFAVSLPQPAPPGQVDAIVVPTGGGGRIAQGVRLLEQGQSRRMLVTGVNEKVTPREFEAEFSVPPELMDCCITLGFAALDTRGNARETARWVEQQQVRSIRLVTSDWHMRRAALELKSTLPAGTQVLEDAVRSQPSLWTLFYEYHKFLIAWLVQV
ncbi:YdcF family protein [Croceibacterium xixiisoli]|uniref:YdcF family protein n=1 Tax=Croceibacterium xixiisoli TaxID=1476466 RepID=UPI002E2761CB